MKTFVPEDKPSRAKTVGCLLLLAVLIALLATGKVKISLVDSTDVAKKSREEPAPQKDKVEPVALPKGIHKLLEKVDIELGTVNGQWTLKDGELQSDGTPGARLQIPFEVPDEYDLVCEFTRLSGNSTFNLLLSRRGKKFGYCLGWKDSSCHFFDVNRSGPNPTTQPLSIQNGRRYAVRVEVRDAGLKAYIDEKKIAELTTNYTDMGRWDGWDLKNNNFIGIGTWESPAVIHKLDMIEIKKAERTGTQNEF